MIPTEPGDLLEQRSTTVEDMLERSLDVLERSQAILERSLAMESTLSRLAEGQEELRRMVMDFINGTHIPVATPTRSNRIGLPEMTPASTSIHNPAVKEEEDDELPSATPASPLRVTEEADDISSVSSVSTDKDVDLMESSSSAQDLEGEVSRNLGIVRKAIEIQEKNPSAPHSAPGSLSSGQEGAEEIDEEDDGASSMRSEDEASTSGEETNLYDEVTRRKSYKNPSTSNKAISERQTVWKCAVCKKLIKGKWYCRQHHIESHEELKLRCPVTGCSASRSNYYISSHLIRVHRTTKSALTVEQRAELKTQQDEINQKAMECEMKYFPPSSLVSFAETSRRNTVNLACKKCGKICVELRARRDHVGVHLKWTIQCPLRGCKSLGCTRSIMEHLTIKHEKTLAKLTEEERCRFEEARGKFYEQVDAVMGDYFPELLQTEERNPFCKKCGKRASGLHKRRDHVGAHLKATFPCPFRHCSYSGRAGTVLSHLFNKHGKTLKKLTKEQYGRYEETRRKFCEQVDAVMDKYFSGT